MAFKVLATPLRVLEEEGYQISIIAGFSALKPALTNNSLAKAILPS